MIEKMWHRLSPWATGRNILIGMAFIVLVNAVLFPLAARRMTAVTGFQPKILDIRLYYGPAAVTELMAQLGPGGRALYRRSTLLIDVPYALVYGLVYALGIIALFKRAAPRWHALIVFPFLTSFFDLLENAVIITATSRYPASVYPLDAVSGIATCAKWLCAAATVTIIATGCLLRQTGKTQK